MVVRGREPENTALKSENEEEEESRKNPFRPKGVLPDPNIPPPPPSPPPRMLPRLPRLSAPEGKLKLTLTPPAAVSLSPPSPKKSSITPPLPPRSVPSPPGMEMATLPLPPPPSSVLSDDISMPPPSPGMEKVKVCVASPGSAAVTVILI